MIKVFDMTATAEDLGSALEEQGFFALEKHPISQELIDRCYALARQFFALPTEEKRSYHDYEAFGNVGYTPLASEKALGASLADYKEFWHVKPNGHSGTKDGEPHFFANLWPEGVPGFQEAFA